MSLFAIIAQLRIRAVMGTFIGILSALASCATDLAEDSAVIEDFSLEPESQEKAPDYQNYYQDLEKSSAAVPFRHSFPIGLSIDGKADDFEQIPKEAFPPLPSRLTLQLGEQCVVFMKTGPVQVNRYLFTGDWIKFGEEIAADSTVKLEADMDINLQMSAQLVITIPKRLARSCWKLLYGRKTFIGSYGLEHSGARLHASPKTHPSLLARMNETVSHVKVYLHWLKGAQSPVLRDEFDFPAVVRSPMYRAKLGKKGFYYLSFQPVLRMRNVNRLVLTIPVQRSQHQKTLTNEGRSGQPASPTPPEPPQRPKSRQPVKVKSTKTATPKPVQPSVQPPSQVPGDRQPSPNLGQSP